MKYLISLFSYFIIYFKFIFNDTSTYFDMFYAVICLAFQILLKTDLLRNPWGKLSSIVDLKFENSLSHEVKQTKNNSHYKL